MEHSIRSAERVQMTHSILNLFDLYNFSNDHIKFFCFQVIEHFLKRDYINASLGDREMVKSLLLTWLQMQVSKLKLLLPVE